MSRAYTPRALYLPCITTVWINIGMPIRNQWAIITVTWGELDSYLIQSTRRCLNYFKLPVTYKRARTQTPRFRNRYGSPSRNYCESDFGKWRPVGSPNISPFIFFVVLRYFFIYICIYFFSNIYYVRTRIGNMSAIHQQTRLTHVNDVFFSGTQTMTHTVEILVENIAWTVINFTDTSINS